ncbi:Mitochondrial import inner membrane translocase subunit tim22 [Blastocladiella emersonii ATCC 22665]|nr:Mitochondrial import inner membrane translocase subunit tim22 [Blastocladiella emersonii ATCC 22665]
MNQQMTQEEMNKIAEEVWASCPVKAVTSSAMSFVLGGAMGLFLGSLDFHSTTEIAHLPLREQLKIIGKDMRGRVVGSAKSLGVIGGIFAGTECAVESFRAKSDVYNGAVAGCITGGGLAGRSGPKAALGGCVSFAAFSVAIDHFFIRRLDD